MPSARAMAARPPGRGGARGEQRDSRPFQEGASRSLSSQSACNARGDERELAADIISAKNPRTSGKKTVMTHHRWIYTTAPPRPISEDNKGTIFDRQAQYRPSPLVSITEAAALVSATSVAKRCRPARLGVRRISRAQPALCTITDICLQLWRPAAQRSPASESSRRPEGTP